MERAALAIFAVTLLVASTCPAEDEVLHSFNLNGTDGVTPEAGLVVDSGGNLYGTTAQGGAFGGGTLFRLTPPQFAGPWVEKILHNFSNDGVDGANPYAALIFDAAGDNLYGTTVGGSAQGSGVVFTLTPQLSGAWTERRLRDFNNNGKDGVAPSSGLVFDIQRNLYGTTATGGSHGEGTVFEISR